MVSNSAIGGLDLVLALTRELVNYSERVARSLGCSESDIWSIYLAATGRMPYPGQRVVGVPFPDGDVAGSGARYGVWRSALLEVVEILGPVEARLRTGYTDEELRHAVNEYFGSVLGY